MPSLTILNDIHAGAVRSAGTTPESQLALREHIRSSFANLLPDEGDLLLNGDLLDSGNVSLLALFNILEVLTSWLDDHPTASLYNSAGNHDLSKSSNILSSFQMLGLILSKSYPGRYIHIEEPTMTPYGYIIPHLRNQDLFNVAIANVPATQYVFVHANFDNNFAAQSDQSLNVSRLQVETMPCQHIIFGHEHHGRNLGKVLIPGNQIASSVSDWLSPGDKKYVQLTQMGPVLATSARRADEFIDLNWKNLEVTTHKFVRVSGAATEEELGSALAAINKFRNVSPALVISNGIETLSDDSTAEVFSSSLESVQAFDILAALRKILTKEEMSALEKFVC